MFDISQSDGYSVVTYPAHGGPNQKWHFNDDNTIRSKFRNLVLDVQNGDRNSEAKIIAYQKHKSANQLFRRVYL